MTKVPLGSKLNKSISSPNIGGLAKQIPPLTEGRVLLN